MLARRRRHDPKFKLEVAREAVRSGKTTRQVAGEYRIDSSEVELWKEQALQALSDDHFATELEKTLWKDAKFGFKEYVSYTAGAIGLVFLVTATLIISRLENPLVDLEALRISFQQAIGLVLLITLTSFILYIRKPAWVSKSFRALLRAVNKLDGTTNELSQFIPVANEAADTFTKSILPAFLGKEAIPIVEDAGIIKQLQDMMHQLDLVKEEVYFYKKSPKETEHNFICDKKMIEANIDTLRILGTMMGVVGDNSFKVVDHIGTLTEKRIEDPGKLPRFYPPFKECRLVVPSGPQNGDTIDRNDKGYRQYPFCCRSFALSLLLRIREELRKHREDLSTFLKGKISVRIRFSELADAFPALQMWDKERCLIICSVGVADRGSADPNARPITAINQAMPIALGIKKHIKREFSRESRDYYLEDTLERLVEYFDKDLFKVHGDDKIEEWYLSLSGKIGVSNWQPDVGGAEVRKDFTAYFVDEHQGIIGELNNAANGNTVYLDDSSEDFLAKVLIDISAKQYVFQ